MGMLSAAERTGRGGALLVEGRPGIGKSQLLGEAAKTAAQLGIGVAQGCADELGQLTPLVPLTEALGEQSFAQARRDGDGGAETVDLRLALVDRLREHVEERGRHGPLLITLDDLQWADPTTRLALRSLVPELASYPLVWLLARTTGKGDPGMDALFKLLEQEGAVRLALKPLDDRAVAQVISDRLGAPAGPDVLALAAGARGVPFLLIELLRTCREEGVVEVAPGHARLTSVQRIRQITRSSLDELSPETGHLLRVAGILGSSFAVNDLADLLAEPVSRLPPRLDEAMAAGVIVPVADRLAFRHNLLWQAVTDALSAPVRAALHRQAGEMLLERGNVVSAAAHFMRCAERGEARALDALDRAAREVLPSSPQTAADLAIQALALTEPADPERFARSATAVDALTASGRLTEAMEAAKDALRQAPPQPWAARLQYELASTLLLSGRSAEAVAEAESLLAQGGLSEELRGAAELAVFRGLMALHDFGRGRRRAEAIVAEPAGQADTALVGALMLRAHAAWEEARAADAFHDLHEAVRIASSGSIEARRSHPRLYLARSLIGVGELEEADAVIQAAAADIGALGHTAHAASPSFFRACLWLDSGRLADAAAEAEAGLSTADRLKAHKFTLIGLAVLAIVGLRRGDIDTAARHIERFLSELHAAHGAMFGSLWGTWAVALVAEAQSGPERAVEILHRCYGDERDRRWMLMLELNAAAWMTRTALAAGQDAAARGIVDTAMRVASDNRAYPALAVAASHARGILDQDAAALAEAAELSRDPWSRASAAEDLAVLQSAGAEETDRVAAVGRLEQAADGYERIGALRDAARVRARLRRLGVRRRHWTSGPRPVSGWDSLTDTERNIALQVAQGMTNRQVASRMFLSPHTVSFHLRQVFRKLGIGSRVELARISAERGHRP
ncbi:LuxR family transcriptional regulator [Actinomadura alba]